MTEKNTPGFHGAARLEGYRSPHLLEQIVDTVPNPIFVKDEAHRWIMLNQAFCTFMGQPREALLGKTDHDFFPKEEADVFWAKDEEVFASGETNINEESFTDGDGKVHVIVTKKSIFVDADGNKILVGVIRDITALKDGQDALQALRDDLEMWAEEQTAEIVQSQALLHQSQKMDAIGKLAAGVAHDFNNLLAVILGNLELIMLGSAGETELEKLAEQALGAVRRGSMLTQRMLHYSRQQPLLPRVVNLSPLVKGVELLLHRTIGANYQLSVKIEQDPLLAKLDPAQMETALINLVVSARDAMPTGGPIDVQLRREIVGDLHSNRLDGILAGNYLVLEVTDDRADTDPASLAKVFDPVFSTSPGNPATDLGQGMVYAFAKQSGGSTSLERIATGGMRTSVYLPELTGLYILADGDEPDFPDCGASVGKTVLVVEDEPAVRSMTTMFMTALGYTVHNASSATEALEVLEHAGAVHVLLTDIILGQGHNGHQLAQDVIKKYPSTRHIYMTGYADADIQRDLDRDPAPLLNKPFRLAALAEALTHVLADSKA